MSWDNVPWFVGGGALHTPEVARLLAFAAFGGSEGVVQGPDLAVTPLPVPTSKVRVLTGACAIISRSAGANQQAYAGRLFTADDINIAATGSGSGRNDLVIARVEDPWVAGEPWSDPSDPGVGPYIFTRVLSNVPNSAIASPEAASAYLTAQGYSAIPLAAVVLPANTGTVTAGLITDLRRVAQPRRKRHLVRVEASGSSNLTATSGFINWPETSAPLLVPAWAGQVLIRTLISGLAVDTNSVAGELRVAFSPFGESPEGMTKATLYTEFTVNARVQYEVSDTLAIPAAARGATRYFYPQGAKYEGVLGGGGSLRSTAPGTQVVYDIEFVETPV